MTASYIIRTRNLERRRLLLERLGYEQFLASARAALISKYSYGKLWKTELDMDDEPVTVVEVHNATVESDGTRKRYFLRVPPDVTTAHEAVAWSFAFDDPGQYTLAIES